MADDQRTDEQRKLGLRDGDANYGHSRDCGARPVGLFVEEAINAYEGWSEIDSLLREVRAEVPPADDVQEAAMSYSALRERDYTWMRLNPVQQAEVLAHYPHRLSEAPTARGTGALTPSDIWTLAKRADRGVVATAEQPADPTRRGIEEILRHRRGRSPQADGSDS